MSEDQSAGNTGEDVSPKVSLLPPGSELAAWPTRASRLARGTATASTRLALLLVTLIVMVLAIGPATGRYRTLTVLSGSMRPWLQPGDVVVVTPVQARNLRVGDVITYHLPNEGERLVTHRIVQIVDPGERPLLQTKGDANNTADAIARLDESRVWRARMSIPKVGWALNAMRSPRMRLIGSVLAPILLLGVWMMNIWGKRSEDDDDSSVADPTLDEAQAPTELAEVIS